VKIAKPDASRSAEEVGETSRQACLNQNRIKSSWGGDANDHRNRGGIDRCIVLLGRSHRGRPEAEDTRTMISYGIEISIAGGGADEKDDGNRGLFLFFYFFISYICC